MEAGRPTDGRDQGAIALIDELDAIEARLDPRPHARGRLLADLVAVVVLVIVAIVLGWEVTSPLLLFALLLVATTLNRLIPHLARRRLRRERERLSAGEARDTAGRTGGRGAGRHDVL